uniref:NADH dehydrogenase subunit 6 n=1 Tax=Pachyscia longicauda TaxID=3127882 RepID=UPI00315C781C
MKLMLMMNTIMNMTFLITKHPLSMGLTIMVQTTIISMMSGMMFKSFWFAYILFLMYIGGMMVLFIYMTSLMPNMMFSMSKKMMLIPMTIMLMTTLQKKYNIMNNDMMMLTEKSTMLMKMYNLPTNMTTMLMASYLLFTMITVFKITESNKGPLRMLK